MKKTSISVRAGTFGWNMNLWQSIWVWSYYLKSFHTFSFRFRITESIFWKTRKKKSVGIVRWTVCRENEKHRATRHVYLPCGVSLKFCKIISTDYCRHTKKNIETDWELRRFGFICIILHAPSNICLIFHMCDCKCKRMKMHRRNQCGKTWRREKKNA